MPRNVRPAWLEVSVDGSASRGTGPRSRFGYLSALLTLRTPAGDVSERVVITAGGRFADGGGRAAVSVPGGLRLTVTPRDGAPVVLVGPCVVEIDHA